MRKVYILPNLFTAGSLFSGMFAIFYVFNNDPVTACWLILLSALLDVADGAIARLTRSASFFGLNFDSLSDLVAFGAAPAIMAYDAFGGSYPRLAMGVCSLYTVCGALRLARFNVQATREERKSFLGLPIPGAALATISLIWVNEVHPEFSAWLVSKLPDLAGKSPIANLLPVVLIVIAYLMVSKVPFVGLKSINFAGRQPFEILVTLIVIASLLYMLHQHLDLVLAAVIWVYVILSVVTALLRHPKPVPGGAPAAGELPDKKPRTTE